MRSNPARPAGRLGAVVLAVALLGACGAGATVSPSPATPSPTAATDEALVNAVAAVWSSPYDAATVTALYASDAVIDDEISGSSSATGLEAIQARVMQFAGLPFKVENTSAPIRQGDFVAVFQMYGSPEANNPGLMVLELKDGKVVNQRVYGWTPSPAASSPAASTDEKLVADLAAVMSDPYDAARVAALYGPDAVIHETTASMTHRGLDEIGTRVRYFNEQEFEVAVTSPVIRLGDLVAAFHTYGTGGDLSGRAIVVYQVWDGMVVSQWIYPAE